MRQSDRKPLKQYGILRMAAGLLSSQPRASIWAGHMTVIDSPLDQGVEVGVSAHAS